MLGEVGVYEVLVPESDTAGLAALAGLALLLRHRR